MCHEDLSLNCESRCPCECSLVNLNFDSIVSKRVSCSGLSLFAKCLTISKFSFEVTLSTLHQLFYKVSARLKMIIFTELVAMSIKMGLYMVFEVTF